MDSRLLVVFLFLFASVCAKDESLNKVNVTVYYESLCPDSRKFITTQLYPVLQGPLGQKVNLVLVPYGKSKVSFDSDKISFTCHHGPDECHGNKLHACALRIVDNDANSGVNKETVEIVNCLMDKVVKEGDQRVFSTQLCAPKHFEDIESCAESDIGSGYLKEMGILTDKLNPPLKSVPTVVFNGKFDSNDTQLAQTDFEKVLKQYVDKTKGEGVSL